MARKVYQVRYYGDSEATPSGKNQPTNLTGNRLRSGSVFSKYTPRKQIGIQSMPGVKFYLNFSHFFAGFDDFQINALLL